ncbi:MAG: 6-phospho-beta-glucosidase, partial [Enterobacteriaceae bacterium]
GGAYYSDAACDVMSAIYNDKGTEHYVNIPHQGHIENIPADWVIEVSCTVGKDGAKPVQSIKTFADAPLGLIHAIKAFEKAAIEAALSGDYHKLLLAMNLNPLVPSDNDAQLVADELLLAHKAWLPRFAEAIAKLKS